MVRLGALDSGLVPSFITATYNIFFSFGYNNMQYLHEGFVLYTLLHEVKDNLSGVGWTVRGNHPL